MSTKFGWRIDFDLWRHQIQSQKLYWATFKIDMTSLLRRRWPDLDDSWQADAEQHADNNNNNNNNNNNKHDNVYGAVIMVEPLREFTRFIW